MFERLLSILLVFTLFLFCCDTQILANFSPGATLNPSCSPFDTGCDIVAPISIGVTCGSGQILKYVGTAWTCVASYTGIDGINIDGSNVGLNFSTSNVWIGTQTFAGGLSSTGNVNVSEILTISGESRLNGGVKVSGNAYFASNVGIGATNPTYLLTMGTGGGYYNQATGAWINGSDRNYKTNILDLSKYGLASVEALRPVSYTVKDSGIEQVGFIAQEVKEIIPELVSGTDGHMGVNYGGFTPVLVKAMQEQQKIVDTNQAIINDLKDAIDTLHTNLKTSLEVSDLKVKGATTFDSEVEFNGPAIFKKISKFIDKTIFKEEVIFQDNFCMLKADGAKVCVNSDQMEKLVNLVPTSVIETTPIPTSIPVETPILTPIPTSTPIPAETETPSPTPAEI